MQLRKFYFENGWFGGYYIVDSRGVSWSVHDTALEAYRTYKRLTAWYDSRSIFRKFKPTTICQC